MKKKHYILLVVDILSCLFFLGMLWFSYEKNLSNTLKYTWIFFAAICIVNTINEARKLR